MKNFSCHLTMHEVADNLKKKICLGEQVCEQKGVKPVAGCVLAFHSPCEIAGYAREV